VLAIALKRKSNFTEGLIQKRLSPLRSFPWVLFRRLVGGQLIVVLVILAAAGFSARVVFRDWFVQQASYQVAQTLLSLQHNLDTKENLSLWCSTYSGSALTFSLLRPSGDVVCSTMSLGTNPSTDVSRTINRGGFASTLAKDEAGMPVLLGSLSVPKKQLVIRAAMPMPQLREALTFFDRSFAGTLGFLGLIFAIFSAWLSRRLVFPLGRLIVKARAVFQKEGLGSPSGLNEENSDEWLDLEDALEKIQKDLKQKTDTIAIEREELATLMSAISDAILAVDLNGNPLFFNSRFALLFKERDLHEKLPRLGEMFRSPEILNAFHSALTEGRQVDTGVKIYLEQAGNQRDFILSVAPLRKESAQIYGAVGIFHDVTELKRAEQIRIDFVANVSHELRTPLTSIKGYTETLAADLKTGSIENLDSALQVISRNVQRLMALIGDLLDLSSLESGSEVSKGPIDTEELTSRAVYHLEARYRSKGQVIETSYSAKSVIGESQRIEQVLINLLENAIKYVQNDGKIRISWETSDKWILLRVSDNGPGIPHEHQPRLFERFYRIDKARSREMGGTGLGLAIVKHIVQAHGGSVYVMSEPGKGTEFICQFPA
jgi:two-component system phosphate regulon sensor histidine kinase PhoR